MRPPARREEVPHGREVQAEEARQVTTVRGRRAPAPHDLGSLHLVLTRDWSRMSWPARQRWLAAHQQELAGLIDRHRRNAARSQRIEAQRAETLARYRAEGDRVRAEAERLLSEIRPDRSAVVAGRRAAYEPTAPEVVRSIAESIYAHIEPEAEAAARRHLLAQELAADARARRIAREIHS